jgi:hypothetical protein
MNLDLADPILVPIRPIRCPVAERRVMSVNSKRCGPSQHSNVINPLPGTDHPHSFDVILPLHKARRSRILVLGADVSDLAVELTMAFVGLENEGKVQIRQWRKPCRMFMLTKSAGSRRTWKMRYRACECSCKPARATHQTHPSITKPAGPFQRPLGHLVPCLMP